MDLLLSARWAGNVRELEHIIAIAVMTADQVIRDTDLSPHLRRDAPGAGRGTEVELSLDYRCDISQPFDLKALSRRIALDAEHRLIAAVQQRLSLTQTALAKFLGIDPKTLWNRKKRAKSRGN